MTEPVFYNNNIIIGGKYVFHSRWFDRGISQVSDFLNDEGGFLSLRDFQERFDLKVNFTEFYGILIASYQEISLKIWL